MLVSAYAQSFSAYVSSCFCFPHLVVCPTKLKATDVSELWALKGLLHG